MKNKKRILRALAAVTMAAVMTSSIAVTACKVDDGDGNNKPPPVEPQSVEITFDANGGTFANGTTMQVSTDANTQKVTPPSTNPTNSDTTKEFKGWGLTSTATESDKINFDTKLFASATTVYAIWGTKQVTPPPVEPVYETVTTKIDSTTAQKVYDAILLEAGSSVNNNGRAVVGTDPYVYKGKITLLTGMQIDKSSNKGVINTQGKGDIKIKLSGVDNVNSIKVHGAGASSNNESSMVIKRPDGTEIEESRRSAKNAPFATDVELSNLPAGEYTLSSVNSCWLDIEITEKLEKTEPVALTATPIKDKILVGTTIDISKNFKVSTEDKNSTSHELEEGYIVNAVGFDANEPGKYDISISYTPEGAQAALTTTVTVYVYGVDEIELYEYGLDSSRVTKPMQKLFKVGDAFSHENLYVHGVCSVPGEPSVAEEDFLLPDDYFTVSTPETTAGTKTVTVTLKDEKANEGATKTASYEVNFVDLSSAHDYEVTVDANASAVTVSDNVLTVKNINDAIRFFKLKETKDDTIKTITVKEGKYVEKVEIDIPNVHLIGEDGKQASNIIIEYDAYNGRLAPGGNIDHNTNGSCSVSVREQATGFYAKNITFQNYYNTTDRDLELKAITSGTQAVALGVWADQAVFEECRFSSYQDTLYATKNRQYFKKCYIEGRTDYIFGEHDSTAVFDGCTIHTLKGWKVNSDSSKVPDPTNGGYVVATKGTSGIKYGYVFTDCDFEADNDVVDGTVSLARGWDDNMTMAVIYSRISKAYSKEGYGEPTAGGASNKNDRYGKMNKDPKAAQLFEFGNTGDGALDYTTPGLLVHTGEATSGEPPKYPLCTVLTQAEADVYATAPDGGSGHAVAKLNALFAKSNGTVTWSDEWAGSLDRVTITVENESGETLGTIYDVKGSTVTQAQINSVPADSGKVIKSLKIKEQQTVFDTSYVLTDDVTVVAEQETAAASASFFPKGDAYAEVENDSTVDFTSAPFINDLFTINAASGQSFKNQINVANLGTKGPTFTLKNGESYKPVNAIKSGEIPIGGVSTDVLTFTAKTNVHLRIYVTHADNGYSGNRPGKITYRIGEQAATELDANNIGTGVMIEVDVDASQVLTIAVKNTHESNKSRFWFFGAEATARA